MKLRKHVVWLIWIKTCYFDQKLVERNGVRFRFGQNEKLKICFQKRKRSVSKDDVLHLVLNVYFV